MAPKYEAKAKERIRKGIARYTPILKQACEQGANEANTSAIVHGILAELLGYDRFFEVSGEYEVKGRWADWAIRVDNALWFFVEVKPVAARLRDRDLVQVVTYARQYDLPWAILTNGHTWQCHRIASGAEAESFFEIQLLCGGIAASENIVSVRKAPESPYYCQVTQSVLIRAVACIVELSGLCQTKFLHREIFSMPQREVKKRSLLQCKFFIQPFPNAIHS